MIINKSIRIADFGMTAILYVYMIYISEMGITFIT